MYSYAIVWEMVLKRSGIRFHRFCITGIFCFLFWRDYIFTFFRIVMWLILQLVKAFNKINSEHFRISSGTKYKIYYRQNYLYCNNKITNITPYTITIVYTMTGIYSKSKQSQSFLLLIYWNVFY